MTFTADSPAVNMQHSFLSSSTILKLRRHSILLDLSSIVVVSYSLLTKTREIVEFSHGHRPAQLPTGQENFPSHNRPRTRAGMDPGPCSLPVPVRVWIQDRAVYPYPPHSLGEVKRREYAVGSVFVLVAYSLRMSIGRIGQIPASYAFGFVRLLDNTKRIRKESHKTKGIRGRYFSDSSSRHTQGIHNKHEDRTNCIFPPFNLPCRTQAIPDRSRLSFNVILQSGI